MGILDMLIGGSNSDDYPKDNEPYTDDVNTSEPKINDDLPDGTWGDYDGEDS